MKISNGVNKKIKIIIPVIIILLILIIGGIFYWQKYQKEKRIEEMTAGEFFKLGILPKGFVVNGTPEYKILGSEDLGITFSVPNDWEILGYMDNFIDLKSPDYKTDPETLKRLKGCLITVEVSYYTLLTSSNLINRINQIQSEDVKLENEKVIKISGHDVLKSVRKEEWLSKEGIKEIIEVGITFEGAKAEVKFLTKIFENEPKCTQEFDKFLETVSIK